MEFKQLLESYLLFRAKLEELLGTEVAEPIIYEDESKFSVNDDELILYGDDGEYWYTISSYATEGKELFCAEIEDYFIASAYPSDGWWDDASVFVFKKQNKID
jgi:hypothetical protein